MRAEVGHGSFSFSFMSYYIDVLSILPRLLPADLTKTSHMASLRHLETSSPFSDMSDCQNANQWPLKVIGLHFMVFTQPAAPTT